MSTPEPLAGLPKDVLDRVLAKVRQELSQAMPPAPAPTFREFVDVWLPETQVRWRKATLNQAQAILRQHLLPAFGDRDVRNITRVDLLQFRAALAQRRTRDTGKTLAPKTVNTAMALLKMIMAEAADRHGFTDPGARIKRLKVPKTDIQPFTLAEVNRIRAAVRPDYEPYMTVRFFTGMRTGEVHGLKWEHVDFEHRQILVRETRTHGRTEYTKNDGSQREIDMNGPVYEALRRQEKLSRAKSEYVFCNNEGGPLDEKNVADRIWYPLLRHLGLKRRRPYQCRHTCATLWLAAGENPAWIARQLGHTTPEMLFRVYSRFVPNLTRRDGSAFERLLQATTEGASAAR